MNMQVQEFSGVTTHCSAVLFKSRLEAMVVRAWEQAEPAGRRTMLFIDIPAPMTWRQISADLSDAHYHPSLEIAAAVSKFVMMTGRNDGLRAPYGAANLFPYFGEDGSRCVLNACFPRAVQRWSANPESGWHYSDEGTVLDVAYHAPARIHVAG